MIKVRVLDCGSTIVDEALPLSNRSKNPLAFTGIFRAKKHKISVPVRAYLIEHPKGLVLIDTGWDEQIRIDARKYEGFFNYFASPGFLPEGEGIVDQLKLYGYKTSDIDYCILTHMDIDHAGGIRHVKDAKHVMCSKDEWEACNRSNPRYLKRLWKDMNIETFTNLDVFNDGSVTTIALPGHSQGMSGIKVAEKDKYLIIAGDVGYAKESYEKLVLPGVMWNKKKALESLSKLQNYSKDKNCIEILMTHDKELKKKTYEIGG